MGSRRKHENEVQVGSWQEARDIIVRQSQLTPKTKNQAHYLRCLQSATVILVSSPAGSGKTYMACWVGAQMLAEGKVKRIILTRPSLGCDEDLGFLPGDANEKIMPYMLPMLDALGEFFSPSEVKRMLQDERIELAPLAFLRGRTFKDAFILGDEAQNMTAAQIKMFLTRLGEGAKIVLAGDSSQSDLKLDPCPFVSAMHRLKSTPGIRVVVMTRADICRHPLVQLIDERLSD